MADPITFFYMHGTIPGANVPAALSYKNTGFSWETVAPIVAGNSEVSANVYYRASNPVASVGGITTLTTLLADPLLNGGKFSTIFDATNNTTIIKLDFGQQFAQIVIPVNCQFLPDVAAQNSWMTGKGLPYQVLSTAISFPNTGTSAAAFVFKDGAGHIMFAVPADMSLGFTCFSSSTFVLTTELTKAPGQQTPVSSIAPTGSFAQVKSGSTLATSFVPAAIYASTIEGSTDAYWSVH